MALSKSTLKDRIVSELENQGFVTSGTHANAQKMAEAIANAIVDEIQANAQAITSMGNAPIE
jgi:capsular polysaccharide biosynthesis protein